MASVFVLYINDHIAGRCLELIRKICEPKSTSKPHVTVRGPIRRKAKKISSWKNEIIPEIELVEPGCFFSKPGESHAQNTVYIKCNSEKLRGIYYKPDFLGFMPHITLYDGKSRQFAKKLLFELQKFLWGFRITLPKKIDIETGKYDYPKLTEIQLKRRQRKEIEKDNDDKFYPHLRELFFNITGDRVHYDYIINLSDDERLSIVKKIYGYLETQDNIGRVREKKDWSTIANNRIELNPSRAQLKTAGNETDAFSREIRVFKRSSKDRQILDQLMLFEDHQSRTKATKPQTLRNKSGLFPTPPELALEIVSYVRDIYPKELPEINFGDPAIGTGTFFFALIRLFSKECINSAYGVEIDKKISYMSSDLWSNQGLQIVHGDYFQIKPLPKRNLIFCNPPYVRHHYISLKQKALLKEKVKNDLNIKISGLASLYIYFILLSHKWMKKGAIAAWLVPTEFMDVNYGESLRKYLTEYVSPILIHRFDPEEVQFEGVLVTSSVLVFKNYTPKKNHKIRFSYGGSLLRPIRINDIPISKLKNTFKWPKNSNLTLKSNFSSLYLKDLFIIKRGIATGANSFFILPRKDALKFGLPEEFLRPILPSPRKLDSQLVRREDDGYPNINPQLSVIDCDLPENVIQNRYPDLWKYLQTAGSMGIRDRYLVKKRNPWYKQEQRNPPPYLCTYLGRIGPNGGPFKFIWNQSNAIATNLYLLLYPINKLSDIIKSNHDTAAQIFNLLCQLSSSTMSDGGRVYGGGLYKIEPRELGLIPADTFKDLIG